MKNWQLYKRNLKTGEVTKAHAPWEPMTEVEARNCERAYVGTYQPAFHFFASRIVPKWEAA